MMRILSHAQFLQVNLALDARHRAGELDRVYCLCSEGATLAPDQSNE